METKFNFSDISSFLNENQMKLKMAFNNRDIFEFRNALRNGANPLKKPKNGLCIFDRALQTPGCSEFIKECLKTRCKPEIQYNFYNRTINFACSSEDPKNLKALLSTTKINTNLKYNGLTPLNFLAKKLTQQNVYNIDQCIRILLKDKATPNIPDQQGMTPLHNVTVNEKIDDVSKVGIMNIFLSVTDIDIDTFRNGELRSLLETEYPYLNLPDRTTTFQSLMNCIDGDDMVLFEEMYSLYAQLMNDKEKWLLFVESIYCEAHKSFDLILRRGVNYNQRYKMFNINYSPIEHSCICVNFYALQKLLDIPNIITYPHLVQELIKTVSTSTSIYLTRQCYDCISLLLASKRVYINAIDSNHCTALDYAVDLYLDEAVKLLLNHGACLNPGNNEDLEMTLNAMSLSVLEEHLDDCISSSDHKRTSDKNYKIQIDFKNFISFPQHKLQEVTSPIEFMAKSKEHRYLLQHPVITGLLYLKWQKLSCIFYVNLFFYLFYFCSITIHMLLKFRDYDDDDDYEMAKKLFEMSSSLGIYYLITREFLQCIMAPWQYFKSVTNYLEILLIICSLQICFKGTIDLERQRNITVACMLLSAYGLFSLIGSLPNAYISTHKLMLEAVCKSFVKCFLLYSIFLITFTLCFYIISNSTTTAGKEEEQHFHYFSYPLAAFVKTVVMFTGEFDAGSLKLNTTYSYLLFLTFVFFMSIILFNLLNGLAVSDTQAIRNQAEFNNIICRLNLLSRYEHIVFKGSDKLTIFRFIYKIFPKFLPDYATGTKVSFLPNDKNKIVSLERQNISNIWCPCFANRSLKIDEQTSHGAMTILKRKYTKKNV